jgi:hypothetical protein
MKTKIRSTRRQFLKAAGLTAAALAAPPFIRHSRAAGKLTVGLWDHWVPGSNAVQEAIIQEWAKKNKVEVHVDFITSIGEKLQLTITAEARAEDGHDIIMMPTWHPTFVRNRLEDVGEVIKAANKEYGNYTSVADYLFKFDGVWRAVPAPTGSHNYPIVARLDLFKQHAGVDLQKVFPADVKKRNKKLVDAWTWENFLGYAEKLHKAGVPFGNPIGQTTDSQDWLGPLSLSFGSKFVDEKGNITVNSDGTRAFLEYMKKLTQFMPSEVYAWDDAGNNRWIISGRGSAILNPPSAWTVAKRDKPEVAAQLWHCDVPIGPKGHFRGSLPYGWGIWKFGKNKAAAKDLLMDMSTKKNVFRLITASQGYDMPLAPKLLTHDAWIKEGPPEGTQYNYPVRGDETIIVGCMPAPAPIAAQMYNQAVIPNTVARVCAQGQSIDEAIKWAEQELQGYLRDV